MVFKNRDFKLKFFGCTPMDSVGRQTSMNTNSIGTLQNSLLQQTSTVQKTAADPSTTLTPNKAADANGLHGGSDQTSLSSASTSLAQALTTSDVRTDKVASLQQAIASGSYHISSSDVADKMLQSLLE
jgi:negative regulator of flagellin synthesis FlgM